MSTFWTGMLTAVALVVAIGAGSLVWLQWRIDQETVTPVAIANPDGAAGRALVVYQPGLGSFPKRMAEAFGEGLAASGWQVSTTTASSQAPGNVAGYDLVVLASPVYSGAPAKPLIRYVERVSDFGGKPVAVLLAGAGTVDPAIEYAERMIVEAGGRPIRSLGLTTMRPNADADKYTGSNTDRAAQIARNAGETLQLAHQ
jgi:hypothetical protein